MQLSDHDLIKNIGKGKKESFQQLFENHYENLSHYAFTILRDMDEAKDIVQNIFLKIWENREQMKISHIKTYLYRSVYNNCVNHLKYRAVREKYKNSKIISATIEDEMPELFQEVPEKLEEKIKNEIDLLPKQCRKIFIMSRYEELKYAEIAETLNISVNTVENQISKALKILRTRLKDLFSKLN